MVAKKLHWTQKPENHDKMLKWKESMHAAQTGKKKGPRLHSNKIVVEESNTLINQYNQLVKAADRRIAEIDQTIGKLTEERNELVKVFTDKLPTDYQE